MFVLDKLGICVRPAPEGASREKKVALGSQWYQGDWRDGEPHGRGKLFDAGGKLEYEGDFAKGARHGWGKAFSGNVLIHEGLFNKGFIYFGGWNPDTGAEGCGRVYSDAREIVKEGEWKAGELVFGRIFDRQGALGLVLEGKLVAAFAKSSSWLGRVYEKNKLVAKGMFSRDELGKLYRNQSKFLGDREKKELETLFQTHIPRLDVKLETVADGFRYQSLTSENKELQRTIAALTSSNAELTIENAELQRTIAALTSANAELTSVDTELGHQTQETATSVFRPQRELRDNSLARGDESKQLPGDAGKLGESEQQLPGDAEKLGESEQQLSGDAEELDEDLIIID